MNNIFQDIKYKRLKHEERFLVDILNKVKIVKYDEYSESEYYELNNEILFEQDLENNYFWVNYVKIWSVLESKYGIKYQEIRILIKDTVWKTLKRKVNTPWRLIVSVVLKVWKTLKRKVNTPNIYNRTWW